MHNLLFCRFLGMFLKSAKCAFSGYLNFRAHQSTLFLTFKKLCDMTCLKSAHSLVHFCGTLWHITKLVLLLSSKNGWVLKTFNRKISNYQQVNWTLGTAKKCYCCSKLYCMEEVFFLQLTQQQLGAAGEFCGCVWKGLHACCQ